MELKHTCEIREIMRRRGASTIYTNKHKTCRSIKCYRDEIKNPVGLVGELQEYVRDNGLIGVFEINHRPKRLMGRGWVPPRSITVRIPLERDRFVAASVPDRPAMIITDTVTSKQTTVPLFAFRDAMQVLNELFGEKS